MSAHDIAAEWYFELLKTELAERGNAPAADLLNQLLRVAPTDSPPAVGEVTLTIQQRITDYEVRLNGETGELISWFADFLATDGDTSMPKGEALALAQRAGNVPVNDARLETADYEVMADRTFFRARWKHFHQDLEVEGDYIEVLINGKAARPFSVSRVWRQPNLTGLPVAR